MTSTTGPDAGVLAVIFDLDGTLLDRRSSAPAFFASQWARYSAHLPGVEREEYVRVAVELDADGNSPREVFFAELGRRLGMAPSLSTELLDDFRSGFPAACRLFPDVVPTLASLRASGYRLGLITNGGVPMQGGKIQHLSLASAFDVILISGAEGVAKPHPEIFLRAVARLGVLPGEAVYIGDNPDNDVRGAKSAGLRAIWRREKEGAEMAEADAVIDQIEEVLEIVRRWWVEPLPSLR